MTLDHYTIKIYKDTRWNNQKTDIKMIGTKFLDDKSLYLLTLCGFHMKTWADQKVWISSLEMLCRDEKTKVRESHPIFVPVDTAVAISRTVPYTYVIRNVPSRAEGRREAAVRIRTSLRIHVSGHVPYTLTRRNNDSHQFLKTTILGGDFAARVKNRFAPSNWCMDALAAFYAVHQGTSSFADFTKILQAARNLLASAGAGYTISDSILKNHLPFHSHPILRLHFQQNLPYAFMKVDTLIVTMSSTSSSSLYVHPAYTNVLNLFRCFHATHACQEGGSLSSGWMFPLSQDSAVTQLGQTSQRQLPRDPVLGIPPRSAPVVVAAVGPARLFARLRDQ
ncbi:hypothetical protein B0H12DRAFT_1222334 [Mycena haematopus]|nr:hypothetical protein B0H12DRAFT_1222334 [Mycena haematopus]